MLYTNGYPNAVKGPCANGTANVSWWHGSPQAHVCCPGLWACVHPQEPTPSFPFNAVCTTHALASLGTKTTPDGSMRAPSLIWAGTEYDQFAGAVVYGWRRRKEWLYLGCSQYGVSRLCNHNIIGRRLRVRASDEFPTWICQTMDEAMLLEHSY